MIEMEIEAVILGNGDYPSHPYPLDLLQQAPYVVCCDGAANEYIHRGHTPDAIIGDGDSLSAETKRNSQVSSTLSKIRNRMTRPKQSVFYKHKENTELLSSEEPESGKTTHLEISVY